MGNCCGKQDSGNFQGEGRALGSRPAAAPAAAARSDHARASLPSNMSTPQGGRTLGKNPQAPGETASPKEAAARAAEERAKAAHSGPGKGKLGKQLDAQKAQTQSETLAQSARDNVAARDADAAAQARDWN